MNSPDFELGEDDLLARHRQERRDFQAKAQSLKKSIPRGDKKKKKEVQDTIAEMEKELDEKQNQELQNVKQVVSEPDILNEEENMPVQEEELSPEQAEPAKMTRAQRRRNKKQEEDKEREKRINEQEEVNKQGPRVLEMQAIKEILSSNELDIVNIPADGNCLYCAVNHQLLATGREQSTVPKLRKLTAEFIRQNKDDFLPFMYNDSDQAVDDKQFESYCKDVEKTKLWGGQLELRALSNILKCPIKVVQASGPSTVQGENFLGPPLVLTYHRHLYRLGEHYNATTPKAIEPKES